VKSDDKSKNICFSTYMLACIKIFLYLCDLNKVRITVNYIYQPQNFKIMKKKFVHLVCAALMLLGFAGCKPEQSELDFGSLQEKALLTGRVTYSLGQDTLSNDYLAEVIVPATGRKVYVDIPMSSYQSGSQGNKIFTGVVDSLGYFTIEVPVKSDGISGATLRYEEFQAERAEYLKMENGKPVFEVRMYKFETPGAIATLPTLMPGSNAIGEEAELRYVHTVIDMKDYAESAVFTGKLLLPYEVSYHTGAYKAAANCNVEITIKDGEDVEELGYTDAPAFTYGCATGNDGVFALNLPIKNLRKGFHVVDATVVPTGEASFVHYVDVTGKTVNVSGAYKLRTEWEVGVNIHDVAEVVEGVECSIGECPLKFIPGYNNGIAAEVTPPAWNDDLAGWVFGEKQFADMTATAKLTGSVKLAQETSFAVGSYATSAQSVELVGPAPYNKPMAVLTKADGTFELEIPIEQEGVVVTGWSVNLIQPTAIAYTHYMAPNETVVIKEGQYNYYQKLRAVDADWNQLGDFYYKFAPASSIDTWNTNLAGWFIKDGYEETVTITAKVYLAQETAYAIGAYNAAEGRRVEVGVQYPDDYVSLVAPVQADGTLKLVIPAKSATSEYAADAFSLIDDKDENFKHFTKKGEKSLVGQYAQKYKFEVKDADWNNKYILYYSFNPSTMPSSWHANLAGWYKKAGYDASAVATGKAYFAKETSYAIGTYQPAANEIVTINVAELGAALQVPVKPDGSFSVTIPLKDASDEYTLSATTGAVDVDDFVHYRDHNKTTTLAGNYIAGNPMKAEDATWNNMGTYYFKFSPSDYVETYTDKLFGWQKYNEDKFANKDVMITGTIKLAEETGFWKGTYGPYAKEKVLVSYNLHGVNFEMVVLSNEDGTFECQAYRTFSDDAPAVSATPVKTTVSDYVHYYHATSPAPEKLEGNYSLYVTDKAATANWNVVGTKYYKFTPYSSANDWSSNLVGWYVVPQKKDNAQFKLYAQKAYESNTSGNHEAKWMNADKVKARVTVSGQVFDMVVSGKNLSFNLPVASTIEDGSTTYTISISLENEPTNSTQFVHYEDPMENTQTILIGNYKNVGNINYESVTADGKLFEIKESAKMLFYENGNTLPSGYSWDITAEHDAN
jgi:hypothetical protein